MEALPSNLKTMHVIILTIMKVPAFINIHKLVWVPKKGKNQRRKKHNPYSIGHTIVKDGKVFKPKAIWT